MCNSKLVSVFLSRNTVITAAMIVLLSGYNAAVAVDKSAVKEKWHTPYDLYLSPQEAYAMKAASPDDVLMIDIRTRAEIQFTGFTDMADANIPMYLFSDEWKLKKDGVHGAYRKIFNEDFITAVDNFITSKGKDKSVVIILMCQSGGRSPVAARELHDAGYKKVYFQVEGFEGIKAKSGADKGKRVVNGWKNAGLPWSYKLKTEKMYFNFAPRQP
jgi:rhodanese-related sulfurtransferase